MDPVLADKQPPPDPPPTEEEETDGFKPSAGLTLHVSASGGRDSCDDVGDVEN